MPREEDEDRRAIQLEIDRLSFTRHFAKTGCVPRKTSMYITHNYCYFLYINTPTGKSYSMYVCNNDE